MGSPHTADRQKELGAFYTPPEMARVLVDWALRERGERMIDPSFGGLVFLRESVRRLRQLGASEAEARAQVYGVDADEAAIRAAHGETDLRLPLEHLIHSDFFAVEPSRLPALDANIGNPPYVRYQDWEDAEGRAAAACEALGVKLSGLASLWAPFILHGTRFLRPGGRLAQVLPAELLFAQYARPVLDYLQANFASLKIAVFEELVFPGALEEVVLLFAEGYGASCQGFELIPCRDLSDLDAERVHRASAAGTTRNYKEALAGVKARRLISGKLAAGEFARLGDLATLNIGMVTGANSFFILSDEQIKERQIPAAATAPIVSKSADLAGARFTRADLRQLAAKGRRHRLLTLSAESHEDLLAAVRPYLDEGESEGVHQGYKCRIRDPWWALPLPKMGIPHLFLTYMNDLHPRLALNEARAWSTNTIHGLVMRKGGRKAARQLASAFYNSLTLLSCEIEGRSYGGGALKLEPTEGAAVLVPALGEATATLELAKVDRLLRAKDLRGLLDYVDAAVLPDPQAQRAARAGYVKLLRRRLLRSNKETAAERIEGLRLA